MTVKTEQPLPSNLSTVPEELPTGWDRFDRTLRAVTFAIVAGVVIAALAGVAGLTTDMKSATTDELRVSVFYARVTRPGIASPFQIKIETPHGERLPPELQVDVPVDYLAIFDENGLDPEPDSVSSDGETETWIYHPDEAVLSIDYDARLQPNIHSGTRATISVRSDTTDTISVQIRTKVFP